MELNKKKLVYIFWGVCASILLYWILLETERFTAFITSAYKVISPFVVGAALAFILNVPLRGIEKWLKKVNSPGVRRGLAMLLTMLVVILVLVGVFCLIIPQIGVTVDMLIEKLPDFFERTKETAKTFLSKHPTLQEMLSEYTDFDSINWGEWIQTAISYVSGSLSSLANGALNAVVSLSSGIFNAILSIAFCLYCLARKEILARQGRRLLYSLCPENVADEIIRILRMTNSTFSRFISGQCLEAVILGGMFAVAMPICGMPFAPLVSVIIAVTALVPIVGAFAGCVLGAFFILVQDPMLAVWFVVLFLVLQQIEGNMIYPKVVGSSIGLPGMWVLVAVGVGGDLMGIAGMLLMIPLAAVLYSLLREFTQRRLAQKNIDPEKLRDQPPEITSKFKENQKKRREARMLKKLQKVAAEKLHLEKKE